MSVSAADMASPAMACLRVSIHGAPQGHTASDLQTLVAKLINAFLETRWQFPRQFEQMTPYAFVLSDPKAAKMDRRALKALAAELQLKLFGADGDGDGEVSLLVFEGSDVEVHRFARLPGEDVERFMDGEALDPPFEGKADRIELFRDLGVRVMQLSYNKTSPWASGVMADPPTGLTDLGHRRRARERTTPPAAATSSSVRPSSACQHVTSHKRMINFIHA